MSTDVDTNNPITIFRFSSKKNTSFLNKLKEIDVLKHGVVVEVSNADEAMTAADAGARAVLVKNQATNCRFLYEIKKSINSLLMVNVGAGKLTDAKMLEFHGFVKFIEESKFLGPKIASHYIDKHGFNIPFVCECGDIEEVLDRVDEGAALIRIQGTDLKDTVMNVRNVMKKLREIQILEFNHVNNELYEFASDLRVPYDLVVGIKELGKFPVLIFAAGGIVTPADVVLMMNLGCAGVFIGNDVLGSDTSSKILKQMVQAATEFEEPKDLVKSILGETSNAERAQHSGD